MATKKAKVETTTINFSNSIEKIKESAKTVNTEVVDTTTEVLEDLRTNGEKIRTVATAKVKEAIENVTLDKGVQLVKDTAKGIHQYNIETAEEIIEATVDGTTALQNFIAKSLKNGVDFWAQQQDITLTALEDLKKQYGTPEFRLRLKELFNFNFGFSGGAAVSEQPSKKVAPKAKAKKSTVKSTAKKVTAKVVKPTTKKVATKKPATKTTAKKTTAKTAKNNLRTIEGIGPKIEGLLNTEGIFTFQQLADAPQATLTAILAAAGPRYKMHNPATWSQQAALAAAGKTAELAKLKAELKEGKIVK